MKKLILATFLAVQGCRPVAPTTAADVPSGEEEGSPAVVESEPSGPAEAVVGPVGGPPRVTALVEELVETINAALAGRELPATTIALPGERGEQVVAVQGDEFPEGVLEIVASLIKVDVTLEGCDPRGGLTIGLLQTSRGTFLVGLGDQFTAASTRGAGGLEEAAAAAAWALEAIERGEGERLLMSDEVCADLAGGAEGCRRMFPEIPDEATLERYREMLSGCDAAPRHHLDLISFILADGTGREFQGIARLTTVSGRLTLTDPILIGAGPR